MPPDKDPTERIARDVRVIRRIIELVVALALILVVVSLIAAEDEADRTRSVDFCQEFPDLPSC